MRHGITLPLDAASATAVGELVQRLAAAGIARDMIDLGYPAHLTLAVWSTAREAALAEVLSAIAMPGALEISLAGIGVFAGSPGVLWLAPTANAALLRLHADLLARCPAADPHYLPDAWVPHVTLSASVADVPAALAALGPMQTPFRCRLSLLELVSFPPVRVLAQRPLGD